MLLRHSPLLVVLLFCAGLLGYEDVDRHVRAAALLVRWTQAPAPAWLRNYGQHPVESHEITLRDDALNLAAFEYRPVDVKHPPPLMLIHGAHYRGMRESRLKEFAAALASAGFLVVTPQLDEIAQHHVQPSTIDSLARLPMLVAQRARYRTAGVIGISFAGSLALLAATKPATASSFGSVTAIGAYASLNRLGLWYAGDKATGPDRRVLALQPHPYGARVLFRAHADTVFGAYAKDAREVLDLYLHDRQTQAQTLAATLPDPPRADLLALAGPDPHPLQDKLRRLLHAHRDDLSAASPAGRLRGLRVPVLLVHGVDDPIVPSTETAWLTQDVPSSVLRASLITAAIRHAELQAEPTFGEIWALLRWTATLLEVNERQDHTPTVR